MENSFAADYLHPFAPENFPLRSATDFPPQSGQMPISALIGIGRQLFINDWTRSKAVN